MRIGIVILTYNRPQSLERCLSSLFEDIRDKNDITVLVIDNGADPRTQEVVKRFAVRTISDTTRSKGYLRNLGWRSLNAEVIVYIDDDTRILKGWSEGIIRVFSDSGVDAATGPCIVKGRQFMLDIYSRAKENCLIAFFVGFYNKLACENKLLEIGRFFKSGSYSIGGSLERSAGLSKTLEIDIMSSCNMAVRRPLLESLEGFDEKFIYNHEDGDLSLRMKEKGYRLIFNPAMALIHEVNPARGTRSSAFFLGRDFGYFYARHAMPRDIKAFLGLACNIAMLNAHWIGEMLRTKRPEPLYGNAGLWEGWRLAGDKR